MSRMSRIATLIAVLVSLLSAPVALAQGGPIIIPRAPETIGRVPGAPAPQPVTPEMTIACTVVGVAAFQGRVHIRCNTPFACPPGALCPPVIANPVDSRIEYYATENSVAANGLAPTALTIATQALHSKQPLRIWFRSSAAENPAGCLPADCRRFVAVAIN